MLSDRCLSVCPVCLSCLWRWCMVANAWVDHDETWHAGRPRPWPHCFIDGDPTPSPKRGQGFPPIFCPCRLWPNGCMDQDATWYEGRPRPRPHRVIYGPSCPPRKKAHSANFRPMSIVAKRWPISATAEHLYSICSPYVWVTSVMGESSEISATFSVWENLSPWATIGCWLRDDRFETTYDCDRRTDRQTDRTPQRMSRYI